MTAIDYNFRAVMDRVYATSAWPFLIKRLRRRARVRRTWWTVVVRGIRTQLDEWSVHDFTNLANDTAFAIQFVGAREIPLHHDDARLARSLGGDVTYGWGFASIIGPFATVKWFRMHFDCDAKIPTFIRLSDDETPQISFATACFRAELGKEGFVFIPYELAQQKAGFATDCKTAEDATVSHCLFSDLIG